jgi:hypothetical protein
MIAEPKDWEQLSPHHLRPAVHHVRKSFETGHWKCSQITQRLCYAALHSEATSLASLARYQAAFRVYRQMIGPTAVSEFDDLLRQKTHPAVFRAYFDVYYEGVKINIRNQFDEILKIGLANSEALKAHPVEWAKSQMQFLIRGNARLVQRWIKEVCDAQEKPNPELSAKDFEELVLWKTWRMPVLIHMYPAGNTRYDATTAWSREGESRTMQFLEARSSRFVEFLEIALSHMAGDAHVRVAQSKENSQILRKRDSVELPFNFQPGPDTYDKQGSERSRGARSGSLMSRYRSELKRGILMQLAQKPNATDLEICRGLDADGGVEVPPRWKARVGDRLFAQSYLNLGTRHKIEIAISKVRADLRNHGLLDRR